MGPGGQKRLYLDQLSGTLAPDGSVAGELGRAWRVAGDASENYRQIKCILMVCRGIAAELYLFIDGHTSRIDAWRTSYSQQLLLATWRIKRRN